MEDFQLYEFPKNVYHFLEGFDMVTFSMEDPEKV